MDSFEEEISIAGNEYKVTVISEKRRNSRASVSRKGIVIRIPHFLSKKDREKQIEEFRNWASRRILKNPQRFLPEKLIDYANMKKLRILGVDYDLRINANNKVKSTAKIIGNAIIVSVPGSLEKESQNHIIGKVLRKRLSEAFHEKISSRLMELNAMFFYRQIKSVKLKNNKSTWGSCSPKGDITLSSRLLLVPNEIIDYVCIHELAHLMERNHSKKFWAVVERAAPDYREKRKWLRKNGDNLRF
jgi:predicted metal-dependent hydrolase